MLLTRRNNSETDRTIQQIDEHILKQFFSNRDDVQIVHKQLHKGRKKKTVLIVYCEGLTDTKAVNDFILTKLQRMLLHLDTAEKKTTSDMELLLTPLSPDTTLDELTSELFEGKLLVILPERNTAYAVDISDVPQRKTEESTYEVSIKGARDGFTEDIVTNVALVRKRLRSNDLAHEQFMIGSQSKTKVSLLYLDETTNQGWVQRSRRILKSIDTEVMSNSQQMEEYLTGKRFTLFPLADTIGRPDYIVTALKQGRIAVLIDGSPLAVVMPANIMLILKSPEDHYFPNHFVLLERVIRIIGLATAISLPGFWVAISSYHFDQLPFVLLTTIAVAQQGVPLPSSLEAFLMLGLFEIFREAGVRLPKAVGQIVSVVGGLIIGETAIMAGLTSPVMLVVISISIVSSFLLVNQNLSGAISLLRIYVLLGASLLGIFGMLITLFSIIVYMARLHSFDLPYLAPYSPVRLKDMLMSIGAIPSSKKRRMNMLKTQKQEGDS